LSRDPILAAEENVPGSIFVRRPRSPASGARTPPQCRGFPDSRQIEATGRRIGQLVYQLYGLTDEEILIAPAAAAS
jgi:hypothetical protein